VLGGRPLRPLDADLRWIGALCYRNGQLEETGLAAGVLNHPATSVAWLANKIAANGLALEAGQVVLAGSFIRPVETRKGDTIKPTMAPMVRSAASSPDADALTISLEGTGHAAFHA
jgi:2-oxo-hept-3-ene-1,7-dioate hydratase